MSDNITLPREVVKEVLEALAKTPCNSVYEQDCTPCNAEEALRKALAAEQPKQEAKQEPVAYFDLQKQVFYWARPTMIDVPKTIALEPLPLYAAPPATHPGYIIGSHWLETAYSRICAGEAEADVLRDCGWERVDEAMRRDAERYRWLRDRAWFQFEFEGRYGDSGETVQELDAAIDAAMGDKT